MIFASSEDPLDNSRVSQKYRRTQNMVAWRSYLFMYCKKGIFGLSSVGGASRSVR